MIDKDALTSLMSFDPDAEFRVGGLTCRMGKMNARTQFHIARRLSPLIGSVLSGLQGLEFGSRGAEDPRASLTQETGLQVVSAIADALGALDDAACNYILDECQEVIEVRQEGGGWTRLRRNKTLMYPDAVDLMGLMTIAGRVIAANLAGFMSALRGAGPGAGLTAATRPQT